MADPSDDRTIWTCPACGKRFSVPRHLKPPAKCRECKQQTALVSVAPVPTVEANSRPESHPVAAEIVDVEFVPVRTKRNDGTGSVVRPARWVAPFLVLSFGWFVWPTPYEYSTATVDGETIVTRTSRLTGASQTRYLTGWGKPNDVFEYRKVNDLEYRTSRISGKETVYALGRWMSREEHFKIQAAKAKTDRDIALHLQEARARMETKTLAMKQGFEIALLRQAENERNEQFAREEERRKSRDAASKLTAEEMNKVRVTVMPERSGTPKGQSIYAASSRPKGIEIDISNDLPFKVFVGDVRVVGTYANGIQFRRVVGVGKWVTAKADSGPFRVMYDSSVKSATATVDSAQRDLPK